MDEDIIEKAKTFCARYNWRLTGRLGFGIHGIVFTIESNAYPGVAALKIHREEEPYFRERQIYVGLKRKGISEVRGLQVPQLIVFEDEFLAVAMTVVAAPYLLDFAGAWMDSAPEFPDEKWEDWNRMNEENFGADWPDVLLILDDLRDLGIHMHDASPSNIRLR